MKKKINWLDFAIKAALFVLSSLGIYSGQTANIKAEDVNQKIVQAANERVVPGDYYIQVPSELKRADRVDIKDGKVLYLYWSQRKNWMPGEEVYFDLQTVYTKEKIDEDWIRKNVTAPLPGSDLKLLYKVVPLGLDVATKEHSGKLPVE